MDIDVKYVAKLARLKLTPEEEKKFAGQLAAILEYMEALKAVDIDGVEPTSRAVALQNVLREDAVEPFDGGRDILSNAPDRDDDYFKVRKVIE